MINRYFDQMVSAFEADLQENPSAKRKFLLETLRLGQRLYSGEGPRAWCGVCVPFDLLNAMGVTSCFVEFIGGMLASAGTATPFLEASEDAGFLADGCGWHRAVIGAAEKGMMPRADLAIASSSPCTAGLATVEHLARAFESPLFVVHVPGGPSEGNVQYLAKQFKDMVCFVTEHTGRVLDEGRLRHAMEKANEARTEAVEVYRLAMRVPSLTSGTELKNFGLLLPLFLGTQTGVDIAVGFREEFAARAERGESGLPGERLRLMWLQESIQFRHPLIRMLREEYQAAIVVDELNDIYWDPIDPEDPYAGLARRTIGFPFNGPAGKRLKHIAKLARAYRVDGVINPCHWGCRQGTGSRGLVEAALKELDIPVINLEVDCADSRNFAEGQLRTRLQAFAELLESRRARRTVNEGIH
jgi:benzoyl-CoA reductase/2-hydroxyglutaryl-CoA dehydratase subunit BcrC/BadD/HgdB